MLGAGAGEGVEGERRRKPASVPKYCLQVLLTPKQKHPSPPQVLGGPVQLSMGVEGGGCPGGVGLPAKDQKGRLLPLKQNLAGTFQREVLVSSEVIFQK